MGRDYVSAVKTFTAHTNRRDPGAAAHRTSRISPARSGPVSLPIFSNHDRRQVEAHCHAFSDTPDAFTGGESGFVRWRETWRDVGRSERRPAWCKRSRRRRSIFLSISPSFGGIAMLVFAHKPGTTANDLPGLRRHDRLHTIEYASLRVSSITPERPAP